MSPISWIFGRCKKLMAKVATNTMNINPIIGRRRKLYKVFSVSEGLAKFVGENEISFSTALVIVLNYIGDNELLNLENTEEVLCDDKLKTIFNGKNKVVGLEEIKELLMRHFPIRKKMSSKVAPTSIGDGKGMYENVEVSELLASFLGKSEVCRYTAMMKVWKYVNEHDLWEETPTEIGIRCDEMLKTILDGKDKLAVDEVHPLVMRHFPDRNLNN